ncbi:MAG: thioredoxin domain-containing protein [Anaerolineae bacterium]|nr:thioredoxin domain-containing protein [Anaerolineae bacterium]
MPLLQKNALGTEQQVIDQYVKAGKASFVYRHYTFLGAESTQIAVAMECAGEQGKFWEFHKQAFENQQPENAGLADQALMLSWAKAVQLDASKFTTCLSNPEMKTRVQQDTTLGGKLGVRGTPTLFINGRPLPGAVPFEFLQSTIESDLAEANP